MAATIVNVFALSPMVRTRPTNYPSIVVLFDSAIPVHQGVSGATAYFDLFAASSCGTWLTAMNFVEVPADAAGSRLSGTDHIAQPD